MGCGGSKASQPTAAKDAEKTLIVASDAEKKEPETLQNAEKAKAQQVAIKGIASKYEAEIKVLFEKIDASKDGVLHVAEFKGVVEECTGDINVKTFMSFYDTNGSANGTIDLSEFSWFLADTVWGLEPSVEGASSKMPGILEWFTEELETIQNAEKAKAQQVAIKGIASIYEAEIKVLFEKIDASKDGVLQVAEFKGVVEECTGDINVETFMSFYDTNGSANGTIDLSEFGWFLAETVWGLEPSVEGASSKMPGIIEWFTEELETIQKAKKKKLEEVDEPVAVTEAVPEQSGWCC